MGISNTFATIPGIVSPALTGVIVTDQVNMYWVRPEVKRARVNQGETFFIYSKWYKIVADYDIKQKTSCTAIVALTYEYHTGIVNPPIKGEDRCLFTSYILDISGRQKSVENRVLPRCRYIPHRCHSLCCFGIRTEAEVGRGPYRLSLTVRQEQWQGRPLKDNTGYRN